LESLPNTLREYETAANSVETYIVTKLDQALKDRNLRHSTPKIFSNILFILSGVWRTEYIERLDDPLGRLLSNDRLLQELKTWKRIDDGFTLILNPYVVWEEHEAGEKDKVMEVIKLLVVDPMILEKLDRLEITKRRLDANVSEIARHVNNISQAIENYDYDGRAVCCYTNIPWIIRHIV
jgi:hypothetical protein